MCKDPEVRKRPGVQRAREAKRREAGEVGKIPGTQGLVGSGREDIWIINQD